MENESICYGRFISIYHAVLKPKGIRLGQAISTTFLEPTHQPCPLDNVGDEEAQELFNTIVESSHLDLNDLKIVDNSMLEIR